MRRLVSISRCAMSCATRPSLWTAVDRSGCCQLLSPCAIHHPWRSAASAAPSSTASGAPDPTLRHPAAFKAAPNIGPGRGKGQEANPFKSWEHMNHKWLILMCMGSLAGGYSAGYFVEVDESAIRPKFERQKVVEDMLRTFEFRPDLAPTSIRVAFVLAARRAGYPALTCDESCAVVNGLEDIAGVYNFICGQHNITMEDCVSLMTVTAVKFLNGPCKQLEATWRWGRNDGDAKPRVARAPPPPSPSATTAVIVNRSSSATSSPPSTPCAAAAAGASAATDGGATDTVPRVVPIPVLLKAVGELTDEECVALLGGVHSVGEFHPHVSGIEDAVHCPGNGFTLDNRYFRFLLAREKKNAHQQQQTANSGWKPIEVSRVESNKSVSSLPVTMRCTYGQRSDILSTESSAASNRAGSPDAKKTTTTMANHDSNTASTEARTSTKKKEAKSYFCVANGKEIDCLLKNPEWRVHTERFAADPVAWADAFQRAMGKMLDSNFAKLRPFPPSSSADGATAVAAGEKAAA